MGEIGILPDGAVLIRNGVVEEYGASRRVENLANARKAREIDATGKIVMPAFVDADTALAYPRFGTRSLPALAREIPLRLLSKRALQSGMAAAALDCVRHGILTVGAHTGHASDLRDTMKVLRVQQTLQGKPLRIRSIISPRRKSSLSEKWFTTPRKHKLSMMMDVELDAFALDRALTAAHHEYSIRLRSDAPLSAAEFQLMAESGATAMLAPSALPENYPAEGPVHVVTGTAAMDSPFCLRQEIDRGVSVALASGYATVVRSTQSPQFLMHLATTQMGLSPAEAITAVTHNAACSLRIANATGSLEPGKAADILVMDVPDYRDLARRAGHNDVIVVMRAGRVVYRRAGLMLE